MRILAIETSCDETSIAVLEASGGVRSPQFRVLKNLVSSQIHIHRPFGGVVPNLAKREHMRNLPVLFHRLRKTPIDLIAVTVGPGLEPALWTGITFAKEIKKMHFPKAKLLGVNHLKGHLYSFLLSKQITDYRLPITRFFPAIALIVSGGHTILLRMDSFAKWKKLGETRDDAVGEAFDKVARMLKLPYPGGPEVEKLAAQGDSSAIPFPRPMLHSKDYDFSFSGLKTSVLYFLKAQKDAREKNILADIAASFQEAALEVLITKTARAVETYGAKSIMLSGGVAANKALRKKLLVVSRELSVNFFASPMKYNTDNAAMIGVAGYMSAFRKKSLPGKQTGRTLRAQGNLNL